MPLALRWRLRFDMLAYERAMSAGGRPIRNAAAPRDTSRKSRKSRIAAECGGRSGPCHPADLARPAGAVAQSSRLGHRSIRGGSRSRRRPQPVRRRVPFPAPPAARAEPRVIHSVICPRCPTTVCRRWTGRPSTPASVDNLDWALGLAGLARPSWGRGPRAPLGLCLAPACHSTRLAIRSVAQPRPSCSGRRRAAAHCHHSMRRAWRAR